ncbi:ferrochelatase [Chlamydiia bacterium]|nr:ferrochelatase [Chlamydiia bacterium]
MAENPIIIVNFGGPRSIREIKPFLTSLLTDRDVVQTPLPKWINNGLFRLIALFRSRSIASSYEEIGGCSPIYDDTEFVANHLRQVQSRPVITFHRYIPATHKAFLNQLNQYKHADEMTIFPMFPQFTYATTGSIARWFWDNCPSTLVHKMRWIRSYPDHQAFVDAMVNVLEKHLNDHHLNQKNVTMIHSAHGIPKKFDRCGDPYQSECKRTFEAIKKKMPNVTHYLTFQSKFGPGEWIKPYTEQFCEESKNWLKPNHKVVFNPISFTSDHIETLFEIERDYMPILKEKGMDVYRAPALNRDKTWLTAIESIITTKDTVTTQMLVPSYCPLPSLCLKFGRCSCPQALSKK